MNLLTVVAIAAIALLLIYTAITLFFAITNNFQYGLQLKQAVSARLNYLPLSTLLKKLNINKAEYIKQASTHSIENQIRNCENCHDTETCLANLNSSSGKIEKVLSFCPNKLSFFEYQYDKNSK